MTRGLALLVLLVVVAVSFARPEYTDANPVSLPPTLDLAITVMGPSQVRYRDEIAITVSAINLGPDASRDVAVLLWLPADYRPSLPVLGASAWNCTVLDSGKPSPKLACTLPSLGANTFSQFSVSLKVNNVPVGSVIRTRGMLGNAVADINRYNDIDELVTQVIP